MVGRTALLTTTQSRALAEHFQDADNTHPWPREVPANRFGSSSLVEITPVKLTVVGEVDADVALHAGAWHSLRYRRRRPDLVTIGSTARSAFIGEHPRVCHGHLRGRGVLRTFAESNSTLARSSAARS